MSHSLWREFTTMRKLKWRPPAKVGLLLWVVGPLQLPHRGLKQLVTSRPNLCISTLKTSTFEKWHIPGPQTCWYNSCHCALKEATEFRQFRLIHLQNIEEGMSKVYPGPEAPTSKFPLIAAQVQLSQSSHSKNWKSSFLSHFWPKNWSDYFGTVLTSKMA